VDGRIVNNPRSLIARGASVRLTAPAHLRGRDKLGPILAALAVEVKDRIALDVGAAAGGFTQALLEAGARRVYAVEVGHGQLLGSLRQNERVVVLERTNLSQLNRDLVPDEVALVTLDLSYLSVSAAVPQLDNVKLSPDAGLVALVKPMFELRLPAPPDDELTLEKALEVAVTGVSRAGWSDVATEPSPILGAKGAREFFLHARRGASTRPEVRPPR
jgi:23S rRNA (cytidine1920-2'-O)/16S rRNA (cytidine1409-2'-O)-methyltransferase